MERRIARHVFVVCVLTMTWACASRTSPPAVSVPEPATRVPEPVPAPSPNPEPPPAVPAPVPRQEVVAPRCGVISQPGAPIATIALNERINAANAPRPSNDGERLLFRQIYETLVRVDCEGHVIPSLASSWRLSVDRRTWIVALREGARFSDGTPVTAKEVLALWSRDGAGGELQPHVNRLVQSLISIDDTTLAITLRRQRADVPLALAHTDLAIAKPIPGSPWPAGTRGAQITVDRETLVVTTADDGPAVRFVLGPGDPRDFLDKGVDLLVTRDAAALNYAAALGQFQSVPLAWLRTYVLLTPGRTRASSTPSEDARRALAADAVRGDARGAMGPFWWQMVSDCAIPFPQPLDRSASPSGRIVYDTADTVARDLAERLVGLATPSGAGASAVFGTLIPERLRRANHRATGLAGEALALARRRGTDAGYVVAIDKRSLEPCHDVQLMIEKAPWIDLETAVPLVETRLHAIVRRGRSGVDADWDGGLLLTGVNGSI